MGYSVDGWTEGPGLPQSVWRYKWLVGALILLGILIGSLFSITQPTQYEGVLPIFVASEEGTSGDPERTVVNHAQFIESPIVLDRVISLTGNRLTRKELVQRIKVEPSANGDFITIRARDTTPVDAAGLADTVGLAYQQILSEQRQEAADQTIAVLEDEQGRLSTEIQQIQKQRRTSDNPTLDAAEEAKRRQMEAVANKMEEASADRAVPPPALRDKAAVPDEPAQPKPLLAAAIGAVVGLVIGVALAWLLAARRRVRPSEGTAESQAPVDHGRQKTREQHRQLADVNNNRTTGPVGQAATSLDKDPDLLYSLAEWLESQHQNFPQITAERLRDRLLFDRVAVLLNIDDGLDLAGCVGWRPDGVSPVGQHDPTILNMLGANGARRIESAERDELVKAGLVRDEDQTIVVAPLKHENVAFGVLLVGQEVPNSGAPLHRNGSFDAIGSFARSVAPDLHAWLLLHKLREQRTSHGITQEQAASAVESRPLSTEPLPSSTEPLPPSAKPAPPPAESKPQAAGSKPSAANPEPSSTKSAPPPAKSEPPVAKPEPVSTKSAPPPAKSEPPVAKPEPVSTKSAPPPAKSEPPAAKSEPPAKKSKPSSVQSKPSSATARPPSAEPAFVESASLESEPPSVWPTYPSESEPPATPETGAASSVRQQDEHRVARG
jgi:capsular polysaccharide biosynthesis protein